MMYIMQTTNHRRAVCAPNKKEQQESSLSSVVNQRTSASPDKDRMYDVSVCTLYLVRGTYITIHFILALSVPPLQTPIQRNPSIAYSSHFAPAPCQARFRLGMARGWWATGNERNGPRRATRGLFRACLPLYDATDCPLIWALSASLT